MERKDENDTSHSRHRRILAAKGPSHRSIRYSNFVKSAKAVNRISETCHQPPELSFQQLQQADMLANLLPPHLRPSETPSSPYWEAVAQPSPGVDFPMSLSSPSISLDSTPETPCIMEKEDWESMAARVIVQKKFSLNDLWGAYTWKNKTSINVRLKLLKDDGYDIAPLMDRRLSSGEVTNVVLAHIAARKQELKQAREYDEFVENLVQMFLEDESDMLAWQCSLKGEQASIEVPIISEKMLRNEGFSVLNDLPLPSYNVPSLISQKRKHCHYNECESIERQRALNHNTLTIDELQEESCECGPSPKKLRVMDPEETEKHTEKDAFRLHKKNIARAIFHLSGTDHKDFKPTRTILTSSVHFGRPSPLKRHQVGTNLYIGTRGLAYIIEEFRAFSEFQLDEDLVLIRDPEALDERNCRNICLSQNSQLGTLMMGDAFALAGLMSRIRKHDLYHTSEWVFNGMEIVRKDNRSWSLSHETLNVLAEIERIFLAGASGGIVKVSVEQFDNGERPIRDFN